MSVGQLDIHAIRHASRGKRDLVIEGLRARDEPALAMRDKVVQAARDAQAVKVVRSTGSPWVAIASPSGSVDWHRRIDADGEPLDDIMVEVVAAAYRDRVIDPSTGDITPPDR